jgi:predicted molibdopterin-dependent oxidoreductase YjgC
MPDEPANVDLRGPALRRGAPVVVRVDGRELLAREGDSVLGVLWAAGLRTLRVTGRAKEPRGFFCGIGICFDCLVTVDGRPNVRACLEPVRPDMRIELQQDARYGAVAVAHVAD